MVYSPLATVFLPVTSTGRLLCTRIRSDTWGHGVRKTAKIPSLKLSLQWVENLSSKIKA